MKHKTAELTGALLDAAVAMAEGAQSDGPGVWRWPTGTRLMVHAWTPSDDWAQGGPIIERERITTCSPHDDAPAGREWQACTREGHCLHWGPTPLIAAMRAYVASKLGDEVDLS